MTVVYKGVLFVLGMLTTFVVWWMMRQHCPTVAKWCYRHWQCRRFLLSIESGACLWQTYGLLFV